MTANETLIKDLTASLTATFADVAREIKDDSDIRLKKHKDGIDNKIWKVLALAVIVIGSVFGGVFALVADNGKSVDMIEEEVGKVRREQIELQTAVGVIDGIIEQEHPGHYGLGNAYDKYIKKRGSSSK